MFGHTAAIHQDDRMPQTPYLGALDKHGVLLDKMEPI